MVLIWLVLAVHTTQSFSVTHDELWHLPAGLRGWSGDFAVDRLNPPLSRLWAALPVRLCGIAAEPAVDASAVGIQFIEGHDDFLRWYFLGRVFHLAWPLATAGLVYGWSLQLAGLPAARLALLCFLCCPNVLAHGSVITPDAAAMFVFLLTSFCLWRWMAVPTWRRAVWLGLSLGALQGIKFTGVVFAPVMLAAAAWNVWEAEGRRRKTELFFQMVAALAVSLIALAGCYGFQQVGRPLGAFEFQSDSFRIWQQVLSPLKWLPVPLPADYILGVDLQRAVMEQPHPIFLDGVWQRFGFVMYYPKSLLYKLPHGFQLLIFLGAAALLSERLCRRPFAGSRQLGSAPQSSIRNSQLSIGLSLFLPVVVLFGIATFSNMQLGIRYVLPLIPVLAMVAGRAADWVTGRGVLSRRLAAVAATLLLASALRFHPHHLAYFNELAGGPVGGRNHLVDSNLDWGQDLLRARDFLRNHQDDPHLLYFGSVPPTDVGIAAPIPPSGRPQPGLYLVSVNFVMGRPHIIWLRDGTSRAADLMEFSYFRRFSAVARLGYSIDVYQITPEDIRRAQPPGGNSYAHWNLPLEK